MTAKLKKKEVELVVNQKMTNESRKAESTTFILVPTDKDKITASKIKLQVTVTPDKPCDFGEIGLTDIFTVVVTKTNRQQKLTDSEDDDEDEVP